MCVFPVEEWSPEHCDLILVVDLLKDLLKIKEELSSRFKMKDLRNQLYKYR